MTFTSGQLLRRSLISALAFTAVAGVTLGAQAQTAPSTSSGQAWPNKTVRIVGFQDAARFMKTLQQTGTAG